MIAQSLKVLFGSLLSTVMVMSLAPAQTAKDEPKKAASPKGASKKAAPSVPVPASVSDLSTRYRLAERYVVDGAKAEPGELTQYRVASRDVIKVGEEKPQGAPDSKELVMQVIYSERPAAISPSGNVTDTVRRYEALRYNQQTADDGQAPKLLEGLDLWVKTRPDNPPIMMLLSGGRRLSETEFSVNARQIFTPNLATLLPGTPRRIGDKWPLSRQAIDAMLGETPAKNSVLNATLADVRKGTKGGEMVAVITITGRIILSPGIENAVKAQVLFTFVPPPQDPKDKEGVVDVRGAITELRLVRSNSTAVPEGNGRLRRTFHQEFVLQRQISPVSSTAPLNVPSPAPVPTEANSWLTYDDPQGRFHFRHPQDLLPPLNQVQSGNEIQLFDSQQGAGNGSIMTLIYRPKTDDEKADREERDPDFHIKACNEQWAKSKQDVLRGPAGWLPESDWTPYKMKVHRIEAALKPAGAAGRGIQRIFIDYYLALLTEKESLVINAMTSLDPPLPFRKEVESVLQTFKLGPSAPDNKAEEPTK